MNRIIVLAALVLALVVSGPVSAHTKNWGNGWTTWAGHDHADIAGGNESGGWLMGRGGPDTLRGFGGNDQLRGNAGADFLDGGAGFDICDGGGGNDIFRRCESGGARVAAPLDRQLAGPKAFGCFGAPAAFVARFDTVRGQGRNGQVDYPYPTVYDEQQNWASLPGAPPGHPSEHVHVGRCIPQGETLTAQMTHMDVWYTFHNLIDYAVVGAGMTALCCNANSGPSQTVYRATPDQVSELQAAVLASEGHTTVTNVGQSYPLSPIVRNGWKEMRQSVEIIKTGPAAIFLDWKVDARWNVNIQVPDQEEAPGIGGQVALRNRAHVKFPKPGNPTVIGDDYHHAGWCGLSPGTAFGSTFVAGSAQMKPTVVNRYWDDGRDRIICAYVTDGGGPYILMIDPNFHKHFQPGDPTCPNVSEHGDCLGQWFWQPPNARKELFGAVQQPITIPAAVIESLSPGVHRLVALSTDEGECFRAGNPCPEDMRGSWSVVNVLPFRTR